MRFPTAQKNLRMLDLLMSKLRISTDVNWIELRGPLMTASIFVIDSFNIFNLWNVARKNSDLVLPIIYAKKQ